MLLFLYNKNIKINLPTIENDIAVYGNIFTSSFFILFYSMKNNTYNKHKNIYNIGKNKYKIKYNINTNYSIFI